MKKLNEAVIIFPHQLLGEHPALAPGRRVILAEEFLFFRLYRFHKHKLVFHRASMKAYSAFLEGRGFEVEYIDSGKKGSDIRELIPLLQKKGITLIHYCDVTDSWLESRMQRASAAAGVELMVYPSPLFMNSREVNQSYFNGKKKYFQTDFYQRQRKRLNILLEKNGSPQGGKWSFDTENREKYPKKKQPPKVSFPSDNEYLQEARKYVEKNFPGNYGEVNNSFNYPVSFKEAGAWFRQFLEQRMEEFGLYEDAIVTNEIILHHSLLSPLINTGLLLPEQVVRETLAYAKKNNIPMNSLEGFIRQIIGWREFVRGVYEDAGVRERTTNFFRFKRKIPASFWTGNTGIVPVDVVIRRILKTGYSHHIERLMVLGNFMVLCEFDPDEVYRWFMEMFIDAYDWVMVPNVYGMSQFADGGLLATKPYISGSNYLMKMSDFEKGEWQAIWDGLFWRFMDKHRDFFLKNPRLGMLVKTFDKMEAGKKTKLIGSAEQFLAGLDKQ